MRVSFTRQPYNLAVSLTRLPLRAYRNLGLTSHNLIPVLVSSPFRLLATKASDEKTG